MKTLCFVPAMVLLAGCATTPIGSVAGGECKLVHTPAYEVKGRVAYDNYWIQDTTEALVRGCKQPRPKKRPASLDALAVAKVKAVPLPPKRPQGVR